MSAVASIGALDQLEQIAAAAAHAAPHRLPLYRAVCDGLITLVEPRRAAVLSNDVLKAIDRPAILLIGDDDISPTGPAEWSCAGRAKRWGALAIVHAAGGDASHYRAAVAAAGLHRRLLLIETTGRCRDAWLSFLGDAMPVAVITTRDNDLHPRPQERIVQ